MKKMLITLSFIVLPLNISAEPSYQDLHVDPKAIDEFTRPLPEMVIFNSKRNCVYQKVGFSNERDLFAILDLVFGINSDDLPAGLKRSTFATKMIEKNPKIASLSKEDQEKLIEKMIDQVIAQLGPKACTTKLADLAATMQEENNKAFALDTLDRSKFTIVEYSAEWCEPCINQEKALNKYLDLRRISVNWLKVGRDAEKNSGVGL